MMRKIAWTTLDAALIVVGITAAWAQTRTWRGGHGPFWFHHAPMGYAVRELDLSDTGKSPIKTIWEGDRPNISELVREFASEPMAQGRVRGSFMVPGEQFDHWLASAYTRRSSPSIPQPRP